MHEPMIDLMMRALDRELGDAERARLDTHLRECASCAREWQSLSLVHQRLAVTPLLAPSRDFAARFRVRLAAQQSVRRVASRRQLAFASAVALFALLVAGVANLAPLADWLTPDAWSQLFNNGLSFLAALAAWTEIATTFGNAIIGITGDGPLVVLVTMLLVLTMFWVWLVSGLVRHTQSLMVSGG
jgi:anti-sigma factor RsiW